MRWRNICVLGLLVWALPAWGESTGKVIKVLPHLLDAAGRHTPAPSHYERDAYQAYLRAHPAEVSGMRFDIQWKSTGPYAQTLKVRLELRGSKAPKPLVLEQAIAGRPWYQRWTKLLLDREAYGALGDVIAWRATVWDGDRQLAEQRSFLW